MPLSLKAKCFNGNSYDLVLEGDAPSVSDLQESISSSSGITPDRQTILFRGQVLDAGTQLSNYSLSDGAVISVVRRIGKSAASKPAMSATPAAAPTSTAPITEPSTEPDGDAPPASMEEMMRALNMGAGGGAGAAQMSGLASMLAGGGGATGEALGGAPLNMENLMAQIPQLFSGLMNAPVFKDYLNSAEKQEQSREAILTNPVMKKLLEEDPEFARVLNDPEKWRASMDAAKSLFIGGEGDAAAAAGAEGVTDPSSKLNLATEAVASRGTTAGKFKSGAAHASRQSAANMAPPGINMKKLSESYGHALGQSLINSGLGLDTDLVVRGLKSAVDGKPFPMALPEYERAMAALQNIASEFLKKANLEDANQFFEEIGAEGNTVVLEKGKIAYEKAEVEASGDAPIATESSTVLVIVSARLLDGRHFFTCPAADEKGDSVHPLTLPLDTAPTALAKGIVGMKEDESRLLYVHPSACEGMTEMFGDLLPPNALLIFDLQLVSASAPDTDEAVGESYYSG